ncbi:HNH endonuclease [Rheinheimera pleomorphica]|uniref:HNH endonuclease n=1 Tax=Rheinheimera pleomorphica TaxID=2703963 RepID=UPI0019D58A61|nr:HNH endonuclease [Rheinheimera pleomorphica]
MKMESRTSFVNRVLGLTLGSTQGKYSYCNDQTKQVLFSLNSNNKDRDLILSPKWSSKSYAHSLKHIDKIRYQGYELLIFRTKTKKDSLGNTVADGFEPYIEKRYLVIDGDEYRASPFEISYENHEKIFREEIIKSSGVSSEERQKRLNAAAATPNKRTVSIVVYDRNPDVVAEVLYRANGCCENCLNLAPFNRKSDGSPYLEVHHRTPLADGGDDTVANAIALCPNCHRAAHYG